MGFAAVRDVASFLRRDTTPANPLLNGLHPSVSRAIGFGVSQSGRFLRDFLHLGFNEDLAGRVVFDGLMPHVAGTGGWRPMSASACPAATRAIRRTRPGRPTCSRSPMRR